MNRGLKQNLSLLRASCNNAIYYLLQSLSFGLYYKPERISILPTRRCNLRCKHCYLCEYTDYGLSTDKWKEIIINLKQWLSYFFLFITGGEPLMREDLCELINFSHKLGIITILNTNGTLIDKHMADRLVESGLDIIIISLNGIKEETHDFLCGDGVYQKIMDVIRYLKNRIRLQISTVIMNYNLNELIELVEFARINRIGISFQGLYWRFNGQTCYSVPQDNELWPKDIEKTEQVIDKIIVRKKRIQNIRNSIRHLKLIKSSYRHPYNNINYHCQAYKKNFTVFPNGIIGLCSRFKLIGNLVFELPKVIWNSKKGYFQREQMNGCDINCSFLSCYFYENLLEKIARLKNTFLTL